VRGDGTPGLNPYISYWTYSLLTFDAAFERESALTLARTDQQRAQAKELITFLESNAK
jgi:hypothetical protein